MGKTENQRDNRKDCLTLRIKKIYFDRILSGEKKVEYRDFTPYYKRLIRDRQEPLNYLYLHYQDTRGLVVKVTGVKVVKTPQSLKESKIPFGPKVFKIDLGLSILVEQ